ncbi:hypothetical protein [Sulfurimonas sp.]|uniref:hypothetical protein n=1 Tax=Sulfurimonas sp. TaxID=2022749 RepID=UPI002AB025D1|nr:hypothetical protein [Sulfurimonas sp.]
MTKKELAQRINVDPKTIKNWESSKPELIKLINLGLEVEKHLGSKELVDKLDLQKTDLDLIKLINIGLATEEQIKSTEEYLQIIKKDK